jgi:hypothetical protein
VHLSRRKAEGRMKDSLAPEASGSSVLLPNTNSRLIVHYQHKISYA